MTRILSGMGSSLFHHIIVKSGLAMGRMQDAGDRRRETGYRRQDAGCKMNAESARRCMHQGASAAPHDPSTPSIHHSNRSKPSPHDSNTSILHHYVATSPHDSTAPRLRHFTTSRLYDSITPPLHKSIIPLLQCSINPAVQCCFESIFSRVARRSLAAVKPPSSRNACRYFSLAAA